MRALDTAKIIRGRGSQEIICLRAKGDKVFLGGYGIIQGSRVIEEYDTI